MTGTLQITIWIDGPEAKESIIMTAKKARCVWEALNEIFGNNPIRISPSTGQDSWTLSSDNIEAI